MAIPRPSAQRLIQLPEWIACCLTFIAGALAPLSLAPFHFWPLGIVSTFLLAALLYQQPKTQSLRRSFCFGLGLFGVGVSWVYVSIHFFGGASIIFAGLLTLLFVSFLALVFSLPFILLGTWLHRTPYTFILAFSCIWMLGEWLRSWLLTGFPWLYLGYAHQGTWLAGWAPISGVLGISFIVAFSGAIAVYFLFNSASKRSLFITAACLSFFWFGGASFRAVNWTIVSEQPIQVAQVQPNIAQDMKWQTNFVDPTLDLLKNMSLELWQHDWIIWPEAAVPLTYQDALPFLTELNQHADNTNTGLITGIIYDDVREQRYYNSIAGFGDALGIYHKRRLVPFGEYVPLEDWLRGLIQLFDLPTSIISIGPQQQSGIRVNQIDIAPAICYELAYPDLIATTAKNSQVLLSISNLGWFGKSIGPPQFLQMGQMRALETGRYLIYNTNNGSSALINQKGEITQQTQAFIAQTLSGTIYPATGTTPFMRWGSSLLATISVLTLAVFRLIFTYANRKNKTAKT